MICEGLRLNVKKPWNLKDKYGNSTYYDKQCVTIYLDQIL